MDSDAHQHIAHLMNRVNQIDNCVKNIERMVVEIHNFLLKNSREYQAHDNPRPHQFNWTEPGPNNCTFCGIKPEEVDIFVPCPGRA